MMADVVQRTAGLRRPARRRWTRPMSPPASPTAFETGLKPWDVTAGSLLTEGGGLIGNFDGEADLIWTRRDAWPATRACSQLVAGAVALKHSRFNERRLCLKRQRAPLSLAKRRMPPKPAIAADVPPAPTVTRGTDATCAPPEATAPTRGVVHPPRHPQLRHASRAPPRAGLRAADLGPLPCTPRYS